MAGIKFTVHYDGLDAVKRKLDRSATPVEHAVAKAFATVTVPYVPMRNGVLNSTTQVHQNLVIYGGKGAPYARYLHEGKVMVDARTGKGPMRIIDENGNEFIRFRKGAKLTPTSRNLNISTAMHPKAQSHWTEVSMKQNIKYLERFAAKEILREF